MAKLMLSWMSQKYRAMELKVFKTEFTRHCLVWEPGAWRPPSKGGKTVVSTGGSDPVSAAGAKAADALAIVLDPPTVGNEISLGREASAGVLVDDATVSARHLVLIHRGDAWFARNPGSTNGSWINDKPMLDGVEMPLMSTDRLRVGTVTLTYYDPKGIYFRLKST